MRTMLVSYLVSVGNAALSNDILQQQSLHEVMRRAYITHARLLLEHASDASELLTAANDDGQLSLHSAACIGKNELVDLFVASGALIDVRDCVGETALICVLRNNHEAVTHTLLAYGVATEPINTYGHSALSQVSCGACPEMIYQFIHASAYEAAGFCCGDHVAVVEQYGQAYDVWSMGLAEYSFFNKLRNFAKPMLKCPLIEEKQALVYALQEHQNENRILHVTRRENDADAQPHERFFFDPRYLNICIERNYTRLTNGPLDSMKPFERNHALRYASHPGHQQLRKHSCYLRWLQCAPKELLLFFTDTMCPQDFGGLVVHAFLTAGTGLAAWGFLQAWHLVSVSLKNSCFECAVNQNRIILARMLLACGASVNGRWKPWMSAEQLPLIWALCKKYETIADLLMQNGATMNACLAGKNVALVCALSNKLDTFVTELAGHVSTEQLLEHVYDGGQCWIGNFLCRSSEVQFRDGAVNQNELAGLQRLLKLCGKNGNAQESVVIPNKAHTYPPEVLVEIARRGGLPELVYRPLSDRERTNRLTIETYYPSDVIEACRVCIKQREHTLERLDGVYIGSDAAGEINRSA